MDTSKKGGIKKDSQMDNENERRIKRT